MAQGRYLPCYIAMQAEMGGLGQVRVGLSAAPISASVNQLSGGILLTVVLFGGVALLLSLPLSPPTEGSLKLKTPIKGEVALLSPSRLPRPRINIKSNGAHFIKNLVD